MLSFRFDFEKKNRLQLQFQSNDFTKTFLIQKQSIWYIMIPCGEAGCKKFNFIQSAFRMA